jgi:hypothetical protein
MRIDQAGHQRAASKIDDLRRLAPDRPVCDLADHAVFDEHVMVFAALVPRAVENRAIRKEKGTHGDKPPRSCSREA